MHFEFKIGEHSFFIRDLEGLVNKERAKFEASEIVKFYQSCNSPYPNRKVWIFSDLQNMINFRNGKN